MDTSAYTHLCRAGYEGLIRELAPGGIVLIPMEVSSEVEAGRERYDKIHAVSSVDWAELAVLTDEEQWTMLGLKAERGGTDPLKDLGECAVIACALHRGLVAVIDERDAIQQADERNVPTIDTLWIVVEAYKQVFDSDRSKAAAVVDALIATGMYLPISNGESLFAWAYEKGILP